MEFSDCWMFMELSGLTSPLEAWFHGTNGCLLVGTQSCVYWNKSFWIG